MQGFFAALITILIWEPIYEERLQTTPSALPAFLNFNDESVNLFWQSFTQFGPIITITTLIIYTLIYAKRKNI